MGDYLHRVATGSDQILWKPSRWGRLIGSSVRRAVSIVIDIACVEMCYGKREKEFEGSWNLRFAAASNPWCCGAVWRLEIRAEVCDWFGFARNIRYYAEYFHRVD